MERKLEVIKSLTCNCKVTNPEPKYHSTSCTYRTGWEEYRGSTQMTQSEVLLASEVTGWERDIVISSDIDFLDRIMMQRTEEAYHYGKRKE